MITGDLENKGLFQVSGPTDILLTEYTIITRIMLKMTADDTDEHTAFKVLAGLGRIAAEDFMDLHSKKPNEINDAIHDMLDELKDEVMEQIENELQV